MGLDATTNERERKALAAGTGGGLDRETEQNSGEKEGQMRWGVAGRERTDELLPIGT